MSKTDNTYLRADHKTILETFSRVLSQMGVDTGKPENRDGLLLVILFKEPDKPIEEFLRQYLGINEELEAANIRIAELEAQVNMMSRDNT